MSKQCTESRVHSKQSFIKIFLVKLAAVREADELERVDKIKLTSFKYVCGVC